jgi:Peptidase A4 family
MPRSPKFLAALGTLVVIGGSVVIPAGTAHASAGSAKPAEGAGYVVTPDLLTTVTVQFNAPSISCSDPSQVLLVRLSNLAEAPANDDWRAGGYLACQGDGISAPEELQLITPHEYLYGGDISAGDTITVTFKTISATKASLTVRDVTTGDHLSSMVKASTPPAVFVGGDGPPGYIPEFTDTVIKVKVNGHPLSASPHSRQQAYTVDGTQLLHVSNLAGSGAAFTLHDH